METVLIFKIYCPENVIASICTMASMKSQQLIKGPTQHYTESTSNQTRSAKMHNKQRKADFHIYKFMVDGSSMVVIVMY